MLLYNTKYIDINLVNWQIWTFDVFKFSRDLKHDTSANILCTYKCE